VATQTTRANLQFIDRPPTSEKQRVSLGTDLIGQLVPIDVALHPPLTATLLGRRKARSRKSVRVKTVK
jgi:hypothetical protein